MEPVAAAPPPAAVVEVPDVASLQVAVAALPNGGTLPKLVHRVRSVEETLGLLDEARRLLWGRQVSLQLRHDEHGPSLDSLAAALPHPLGPGRDAGYDVHLTSSCGLPACLFSERPSVVRSGGSYGPKCDGCVARPECSGVSASYLARFGDVGFRPLTSPAPDWKARARWLLVDRPMQNLPVTALLPPESRPKLDCTLPWTRLELAEDTSAGPCCSDYQVEKERPPHDRPAGIVWNDAHQSRFRLALASQDASKTCKNSCPVLQARSESFERFVLRGGPPEAVEQQLEVVEAMRTGATEVPGGPLMLVVSVTSFCNYDCLMCDCGVRGTLDDERPPAFWEALRPLLPGMRQLAVNGGEPLASPVFRAFLETIDADALPQLRILLTTNGSYLTPRQVEKLDRTPLADVTVSLNAATADSYLAVNRGLPFERILEHLDALGRWRRAKRGRQVSYSMVLLRRNVQEIRAFARLAAEAEVGVRFLLPNRNRNDESILLDPGAMRTAVEGLEAVAKSLRGTPHQDDAVAIEGSLRVLEDRLRRRVLAVL